MSLVAYGSSDESEEEEEVTPMPRCTAPIVCEGLDSNLTTTGPRASTTIELNSMRQNSDVDVPVDGQEKAEHDSRSEKQLKALFQNLPQPKQDNVICSDQDELESHTDIGLPVLAFLPVDVPQSGNNLFRMGLNRNSDISKKSGSGPVKITLPSLSQFNEDEEDEPIKKKLKPSIKGSGLFAILPAPKNVKSKETQQPLIPHVLTKKTLPTPGARINKLGKQSLLQVDYESEDDEDFFSLNAMNKLHEEIDADLSTDSSLISTMNPSTEYKYKTIYGVTTHEEQHSATLPSLANTGRLRPTSLTPGCSKGSLYNYQDERISTNNPAVQPTAQEPSISFASEDLQLNAEAMQRLCGRRSKKNQEPVEIIDVNGTEIMPDPSEWLIKQLSEEQPKMRSHSHKRNDGPTTQQRRKHQITYLAFQAKENELELKNQWSQNRMTRKQTQSKYGF